MSNQEVNLSIDNYKKYGYEKFREYDRFKFVVSEIKKNISSATSLLDIGGAKGELVYLLKEYNEDVDYFVLEYSKN